MKDRKIYIIIINIKEDKEIIIMKEEDLILEVEEVIEGEEDIINIYFWNYSYIMVIYSFIFIFLIC